MVKDRKPTLKTLFYYYLLFCACYGERKMQSGSYMHVLNANNVRVFGEQGKDDSGYNINNITLTVSKKPEGKHGFWQYDHKRLCVVLPMATFRNYSSDKWARSYGQYVSLCNRLMDEKSFTDFVQYLEKDIKSTLSHEFTHAWQNWKQDENKRENKEVNTLMTKAVKRVIPFGSYVDDISGYIICSDETEARRSGAQQLYRSSGKSYVDCFAKALTFKGDSYKQLKTIWMKNKQSFNELTVYYFMYIVLPKDKTFQQDLKKHTVVKKGVKTYTGTYATYMNDLENFKDKYEADRIEKAFSNLKRYYEFIAKNAKKINGYELIRFNEEHKNDEDMPPSDHFWTFWSSDKLVQKYAFEPVEKQLSEL